MDRRRRLDPHLATRRRAVQESGARERVRFAASLFHATEATLGKFMRFPFDPGNYYLAEVCNRPNEQGQGHGTGFLRSATARGTFAGRRMPRSVEGWELSFLLSGVTASECSSHMPRVRRRGDMVRVDLTLPPPNVR